MNSAIVVHNNFDKTWPFAADHLRSLWERQGELEFVRLNASDDRPLGEVLPDSRRIQRLIALSMPVTDTCMEALAALEEAAFLGPYDTNLSPQLSAMLERRSVKLYRHQSEGFWGQSVAEFALGLTICALRRIPQTYRQMIQDHRPWDYSPPSGIGRPGARGAQFGDEPRFVNGTIDGKRIRIVGMGNIGSRYAGFVHKLGADVAAWDPFATASAFDRSGCHRVEKLDELLTDAQIFAPMVPLTASTRGLITARHIACLPRGSLAVVVTRAGVCDFQALRKSVLADELALAADVFDVEPLPLDDPLLARPNVVHTPHNAGRTIDANRRWAEALMEQFRSVD
jgi:phosphoglycerate dehydrogenase-like enzyme